MARVRLPSLSSREVIGALERGVWQIVRQRGSHIRLRRVEPPPRSVTVPVGKDLNIKTTRSILLQAGLTVEELLTLLRG